MTSRLLVIDDDALFRKRIARAFRERGLEVGEASNTSEAIEYVEREKPRLVLLDLRLKDESGLTVLQKLLEIDRSLKIVVLTGYGTVTTAVGALRLGAVNYLMKPVDADSVLAAFREVGGHQPIQLTTPNLEQVEWDHIQRVVNDCEGNITQASKILGLHRRSLQRKLTKIPQRLK